jgi:hypothetical protein
VYRLLDKLNLGDSCRNANEIVKQYKIKMLLNLRKPLQSPDEKSSRNTIHIKPQYILPRMYINYKEIITLPLMTAGTTSDINKWLSGKVAPYITPNNIRKKII